MDTDMDTDTLSQIFYGHALHYVCILFHVLFLILFSTVNITHRQA